MYDLQYHLSPERFVPSSKKCEPFSTSTVHVSGRGTILPMHVPPDQVQIGDTCTHTCTAVIGCSNSRQALPLADISSTKKKVYTVSVYTCSLGSSCIGAAVIDSINQNTFRTCSFCVSFAHTLCDKELRHNHRGVFIGTASYSEKYYFYNFTYTVKKKVCWVAYCTLFLVRSANFGALYTLFTSVLGALLMGAGHTFNEFTFDAFLVTGYGPCH